MIKMPRTKEILVYKFDELSEKAKEKVLQRERQYIWENGVGSEDISHWFKEYLTERGLPTDVSYSLSYCQGDGVAFDGGIDIVKFLKFYKKYNHFKKLINSASVYATIKSNRGYGMSVNFDADWDYDIEYEDDLRQAVYDNIKDKLNKELETLKEELYSFIEDTIKEVAGELEDKGYKYIEDLESEENIKEMLEANEVEFDEDGDRI